jgi:hypothetical protein
MIEAIFLIEESDSLLPTLISLLGVLAMVWLFLGGQ